MRTLLSEEFAPVTSSIGFLEAPLETAAAVLEAWRRSLYPAVEVVHRHDGFPEVLRALEPLTDGARPRELLVRAGRWTAYFDCSLQGTDAVSAVGHLTRTMACQGVAVDVVPHTFGVPGIPHGRMGAVQFELFGPLPTDFLNYVRTVSVAFDGTRWQFNATGTKQPYEDVEAYRARRVRERFTSAMLEQYCRALGIDVFDAGFYGPDAVLVTSDVPLPPNARVVTLREAQALLGIEPGVAEHLAG